MKICYEKTEYHIFTFEFSFSNETLEFCRFLKDSYGWKKFSFSEGKWRFNDPMIIFLVQTKYPNVVIEEKVIDYVKGNNTLIEEQARIEENAKRLKNSIDSDLVVENLKGDLYPYQKIGVEFFINNKGRAILADSPGSGKTLQTLAFIVKQNYNKSLIVCPASVKFSWEGEVKKWTHLTSFVIDSKTDVYDIPKDVNVVIINYDILKKFYKYLVKVKFDCMVNDESHLLKTKTSVRSKVVKLLSRNIESIIMLSGTPLLSRPIELYNMLNILDSKTWDDYYGFAERYCEGKRGYYGYEAKGATNLAELSEKIGKYFLRRTKDQILKQLPPKNRIYLPIELSGEQKTNYEKVQNEFVKYLRENKGKKDKQIEKSLSAEKLVKINYLREISSLAKLDSVREQIDSIIDSGEKVIVFSCFNEPLRILRDEYPNSVLLLGETKVEDRGPMVNKFQEDKDCKVFFGGIKSAGVGITLTAATNVIFIDYSWNPADHEQGEDRMHRPGQVSESVNIYNIHAKNTIDDFMVRLLRKKTKIFQQVIDTQKSLELDEDEIIKLIEN